MIVTLRMPGSIESSRAVELAVVPREGETVIVDGDSWTVHRVVHYPVAPGSPPRQPYVVIRKWGVAT
jgi:hypothetical protein